MEIMEIVEVTKEDLIEKVKVKGSHFVEGLKLEKYTRFLLCDNPYLYCKALPLPVSDTFRVIKTLNVIQSNLFTNVMYGDAGITHYVKNGHSMLAYVFVETKPGELLLILF